MAQRTVADVARVTRQSHWREDEARLVVEAWRRSGESRLRFAARHGIDPKRLRRWIVRLARATASATRRSARRRAGPTSVQFHPVHVVEGAEAVTPSPGPATHGIEVVLGDGRSIRVPPGFAAADLARVLAVVEAAGRSGPHGERSPCCDASRLGADLRRGGGGGPPPGLRRLERADAERDRRRPTEWTRVRVSQSPAEPDQAAGLGSDRVSVTLQAPRARHVPAGERARARPPACGTRRGRVGPAARGAGPPGGAAPAAVAPPAPFRALIALTAP